MKKSWSGAGLMAHALTAFKARKRREIRLGRRRSAENLFAINRNSRASFRTK